MLIKLGEAIHLSPTDLKPFETVASDNDLDIDGKMQKFAHELKVIAPQAKDFLYFTCVMMHAAEASLVNEDGSFKKLADGSPVAAHWEKTPNDGVKWVCSDSRILPYKNNNNDIFPESELKVAYKKWVGRPLCLDHKSDSVDKIRGVIVDTVWDDKRRRVIALCALDKKNYPDLAHKVSSGVATNVSMGTAVGRAVCTEHGCHRVARTEKDFCNHMKLKSCYGEINLDLSPIELSLVVSGADPKAKVKHVIAQDLSKAAELLTDYLKLKESAQKVSTQDLASIKRDIIQLTNKLAELEVGADEKNESGEVAMMQGRSQPSVQVLHSENQTVSEQIPAYASELQKAILRAQTKIASLQDNYTRLSSMKSEEPNMTTKNAYYQGTVEPKPGETMYTPDPLADKARLMDKHLHGPGDFPNVGDVEGMYPGITQDDKDLKKTLQRLADEEERAMFREAALKKAKEQLLQRQAYYNGTTEPTPGKPQYKPDPGLDIREDDKFMEGAKPFPDVGKVDGLYGDDAAVKEKLSRASLKARFNKVALPDGRINKGASNWSVFAGDKLVLTATIDQITKGNSNHLYDAIATKRFGESLLTRIKTEGFTATAQDLLKTAEPAPAAPPVAAPAAPAPDAAPGLEPPKDVDAGGGTQTIQEVAKDIQNLADELTQKANDLVEEAGGAVKEDAENVKGGEGAGDKEFEAAETGLPQTTASLQKMRKTVNGLLLGGIEETAGDLLTHAKELRTAREVYLTSYASMTPGQRQYLNALTVDAVKDARALLAETTKLMGAVIKYAYGAAELEKRASEGDSMPGTTVDENDAKKCVTDEDDSNDVKQMLKELGLDDDDDCGMTDDNDVVTPPAAPTVPNPAPAPTLPGPDAGAKPLADEDDVALADDGDDDDEDDDKGDVALADDGDDDDDDKADLKLDVDDATGKLKGVNASTKEQRAVARTKIAQKGLLGFNELAQQAHPGGSAKMPGKVETKPSVDDKFHVFKDIKDYMLDLANLPPKVRKQAEMIHRLITAGQLKIDDVEQLTSFGVDADAVKYYRQMWAQSKGDAQASEFARKLTDEHEKQKTAEDLSVYKARVKRAYELSYEMRERGMIEAGRVEEQVSEIMKWNDEGFNSMKRMIARQPVVKQASVPMVGLLHSGDVILPAADSPLSSGSANGGSDIKNFFDDYFSNKKF